MRKMNSLKGIFDTRVPCKRNFIQENVKQLRSMQKTWNNKEKSTGLPQKTNKCQHSTTKVHGSAISEERARTSHASTRTSTRPTTSGVQLKSDGRQRSKSAQISLSRPVPKHTSLSNSNSAGKHSNALERDFSDKATKADSKQSSRNDVNSIAKPISTMTVSRSKLSDDEIIKKLDAAQHGSENYISVQPYRNMGCQTVSPEDRDSMFNQGVIKYPSSCNIGLIRSESAPKANCPPMCDSFQQTDSSPLDDKESMGCSTKHADKILSSNVNLQSNYQMVQPVHERLLQRFKGASIGSQKNQHVNGLSRKFVSPRKSRNKEKAHNESKSKSSDTNKETEKNETPDPACPVGHVPLPDTERVETLKRLRKSYEDHIRELNCLPVKTDTLKMRQKKIDLEKQLNKLEEGIKVFSRPKVFVKIGV